MKLERLLAIVRADFLTRFRRVSTAVNFVLLSAFAYLWVPAPSTGRTILTINGSRALYNSAAIGMATATLGTIFIGLFGFYVVSNALRRDTDSRCGFVIASTTMRGSEYLLAKFLGNFVFLTTFMSGFMLASMSMQLVRGEAPLEPLVFMKQYLLMVPPAIAFVSGVAVLFECVPFLSGRFGDVVYFFLWAGSLGIVVNMMEHGNAGYWLRYFDYSSFGYLFDFTKRELHTTSLSIGSTSFDKTKAPFVFQGLNLSHGWLLPRIGATLLPLSLLGVARLFFHRFDPARVRAAAVRSRTTWLARFNALVKPLSRLLFRLGRVGGTSLLSAAINDALLTLTAMPVLLAIAVGVSIAGLAAAPRDILPIAFAAFGIAVADVACREVRSGTSALVYAAPKLNERYVLWKLLTITLLALGFLGTSALRLGLTSPAQLPALLVGTLFVAAAAIASGVFSSTPKAFIVVFLTFWYIVVNDKGHTPRFDFAGFFGSATPAITLSYAALTLVLLFAAHVFRELRARRA